MNEEEFLKEHPDFKGLIVDKTMRALIHEYTLSKQKVKEVIDRLCILYPHQLSINMGDKLKKELGVEDK